MDYRTIKLDEYGLKLDIGIVPNNELSVFLSRARISKGAISQQEWEKFLLDSLIKNTSEVQEITAAIDNERDRTLFRHELIELIYKLNNRLKPQHIVVTNDKLLHITDAIRSSTATTTTLLSNPGWLEATDVNALVDSSFAKEVIESSWEKVKQHTDRNYLMEYVQIIDMEIPILEVASMGLKIDDILQDFIVRRCQGDIDVARSGSKIWVAHVLSLVIPEADKFAYSLSKGGYMNLYTENILMTQLYLAATRINPILDWNSIDWDKYLAENSADPSPQPGADKNNKRILPFIRTNRNRHAQQQQRSSKVEAEAEKPKFTDIAPSVILGLKEKIKQRIIGQDEAVDSLVDALAISRVGLRGDKRPIGSFLLAGTTGVGKTELAKVIADELGVPLHRVDCSEYQHAHEISKLIGAPPGYVGFEDINNKQGQDSVPPMTLVGKIKAKPFSVVLFDELEKAHEAVFHMLLQIMDEGHTTSGRGETVSFNQAVILMTSNIGTREAAEECERTTIGFCNIKEDKGKLSSEVIDKAIKDTFRPEFLNRLSETIFFNKLSPDVCSGIVDILLDKTKENLEKAQHMTMKWDDDVRKFIIDNGFSEDYGARNLERTIRKTIELPLALHILENKYVDNKVEEATDETAKKLNFLPKPITDTNLIRLAVNNEIITFTEENEDEKIDISKKGLSDTKHPKSRRRTRSDTDKTQGD
jgi:hypothetical protein